MIIQDFCKFFLSNCSKLTLPVLLYGKEINSINEVVEQCVYSHFPDLEISTNDFTSVEDIGHVISFLMTTPIYHKYKFIILKNAQKWSRNIFSSLLKSLEDYPEYNKIIITSNSMLEMSIVSRCYKWYISPSSDMNVPTTNLVTDVKNMSINQLFVYVKQNMVRAMQSNNFILLDYIGKLWDKVNEVYTWYRKGEESSDTATQIIQSLILDYLEQVSSL
ncbi:MAG: hypothetical protein H6845_00400 [Alphaproteobacteria bacterium]|nr:MAG: hypothetical protein H6845_00400 [Alphaproteobacteria bacterium]